MNDDIAAVFRNQAFSEISRIAARVESYARSLEEAAWRGDAVTVGAHLKQMRACLVSMIQTHNDYLREPNGQDASPAKPALDYRHPQRVGDGDARGGA